MKEMSVKKIILSAIAALSALLLLIGMKFSFMQLRMVSEVAGSASVGVGVTSENGFSMLDFNSLILKSMDWSSLGVIMGFAAYLSLMMAVVGLLVNMIAMFLYSAQKARKIAFEFLLVNVLVAVVYFVAGIVVSSSINSELKDALGTLYTKELGYSTSAFWPFIFQTVIFIAFIVCDKLMKKPTPKIVVKTEGEKKTKASYAEKELAIIQLLIAYKKVYLDGTITVMDFEKKKYLLMFDNKSIDLDAEKQLIEALINYRKIYDEEIINRDEYEKKKLQILFA